jgi:hypothetical protein
VLAVVVIHEMGGTHLGVSALANFAVLKENKMKPLTG